MSPYVHGHQGTMSVAMCAWGVVMAIGKGCHAIAENTCISFIIKSVQACLVNFDCPQEVVGGAIGSKSTLFGF